MDLEEYKKVVAKVVAPNFEGGVEKLREILVKHWMWRNDVEGGKRADLSYADLFGADLSDTNLSCANLSWADLRYANLSWANLSHADLSDANLTWANLSGANLFLANLFDANLSHADLSHVSLSCANLSCANLSGAIGIKQAEQTKKLDESADSHEQTMPNLNDRILEIRKIGMQIVEIAKAMNVL